MIFDAATTETLFIRTTELVNLITETRKQTQIIQTIEYRRKKLIRQIIKQEISSGIVIRPKETSNTSAGITKLKRTIEIVVLIQQVTVTKIPTVVKTINNQMAELDSFSS
jgi:hypothetical protein